MEELTVFIPSRECKKLDKKTCLDSRLMKACRIVDNKCVENKYRDLEYIEDFPAIEIDQRENVEQQLNLRKEVCKSLPVDLCGSNIGKAYNCKIKKNLLGRKRCELDKKFINSFQGKCMVEGCKRDHYPYKKLCLNHQRDFDQLYEILKDSFKRIKYSNEIFQPEGTEGTPKKYIIKKDNNILAAGDFASNNELLTNLVLEFKEAYDLLKLIYINYIIQRPGLVTEINDMIIYLKENNLLDEISTCTAMNIENCKNIYNGNKVGEKCRNDVKKVSGLNLNKDIELNFCNIHKECFKKYYKNYVKLRDNLDILIEDGTVKKFYTKNLEFYDMIKYTGDPGAGIKIQVLKLNTIIKNIL